MHQPSRYARICSAAHCKAHATERSASCTRGRNVMSASYHSRTSERTRTRLSRGFSFLAMEILAPMKSDEPIPGLEKSSIVAFASIGGHGPAAAIRCSLHTAFKHYVPDIRRSRSNRSVKRVASRFCRSTFTVLQHHHHLDVRVGFKGLVGRQQRMYGLIRPTSSNSRRMFIHCWAIERSTPYGVKRHFHQLQLEVAVASVIRPSGAVGTCWIGKMNECI